MISAIQSLGQYQQQGCVFLDHSADQLTVELSIHASQKLETYGIVGERLDSWRAALRDGDPFEDRVTGASGLLVRWEERPWVVILRDDRRGVITTYPSDDRTVQNRRGGGRWIFPNS